MNRNHFSKAIEPEHFSKSPLNHNTVYGKYGFVGAGPRACLRPGQPQGVAPTKLRPTISPPVSVSSRPPILTLLILVIVLTGCSIPKEWHSLETAISPQTFANADRELEGTPVFFQPDADQGDLHDLSETGGRLDLSVEQAAFMALRHNSDLRVRQINPIIAGTFEMIERGVFDPELFAEMRYEHERFTEISRDTGKSDTGSESVAVISGGVRKQLPIGATVEATVEQSRDDSDEDSEDHSTRLGLSITQSLLRGFGPAVNLVSLRQAELESAASLYELRGYAEALLAETEIAYWDHVLAVEKIRIFENSLDVARKQLNDVEQRIDVGMLPKIEAAAAKAEVARREQDLINARSDLDKQRLRLLRLILPRANADTVIRINSITDPRTDARAITDLAERLALAEKSRPDLNEARLRLDRNRLEVIKTRNGALPKLDLFMALGKTGYGDTFLESARSLGDDTFDFTAGVRLSHFPDNRTATAWDTAARATREQAARAVENLRRIVDLDVRLAVTEVERARLQIAASGRTHQFEKETFRAEKERFDVGASTALLVAQAQRDLLASRIAEVEEIVGYRKALVELYLAEGSLLERRGVGEETPARAAPLPVHQRDGRQ